MLNKALINYILYSPLQYCSLILSLYSSADFHCHPLATKVDGKVHPCSLIPLGNAQPSSTQLLPMYANFPYLLISSLGQSLLLGKLISFCVFSYFHHPFIRRYMWGE